MPVNYGGPLLRNFSKMTFGSTSRIGTTACSGRATLSTMSKDLRLELRKVLNLLLVRHSLCLLQDKESLEELLESRLEIRWIPSC